jgi:hypothetical protein
MDERDELLAGFAEAAEELMTALGALPSQGLSGLTNRVRNAETLLNNMMSNYHKFKGN